MISDEAMVLRGVSWLDTANGARSRRDIGVDAGVVVPADELSAAGEIDASGLTGMWGLWDCHAHAGGLMYDPDASGYFEEVPTRTIRAGQNLLEAAALGVTGIRCVDDADDIDLAWSRAFADGVPPGPRVMGAGRGLRTTGGHGTAYPRSYVRLKPELVVDGPTEMARAVRRQVERGAHWIKIMLTGGLYSEHETVDGAQFTDEELRALMAVADQRGVPVAAHCGGSQAAITFSELGGRSIEHGYALDEHAAEVMARSGTWLVPTLSVTHDQEFIAAEGWPAHAATRAKESMAGHAAALHACLEAGVRLAVGSDLNPIGERLHRELAILEGAGIDRLTLLHAATVGGRELNGLGDASTPEPDCSADLLLVEGDPLEDLDVLRSPAYALAHGRLIRRP